MATEVFVGRIRSVVLLVLFSILTLNLYYFYWLYKVNAELRAFLPDVGRPKPVGRLLLFLLIPVIGWFFAAYFTARSALKAQVVAGDSRPITPIYAGIWAGLVPVIGWYVAAGQIQGGANRAWARAVEVLETTLGTKTRLECPDCSSTFRTVLNPIVPHSVECPTCHRSATV